MQQETHGGMEDRHLHLHKFEEFFVVGHVTLVHKDHDSRKSHLDSTEVGISAIRSLTPTVSYHTCFASSTCSRVCGIGPSGADTTRMAPSMQEAPVIIFFT